MLDHPAIDVRDIRKTYPGGVEAVRGLGFQVGAGEVFGLLGPNGAGKSTTIGMLTTTVAPTSGSARVAGFDVATEPRAARRVSGIVFQDSAIDRALTGRRNLDIHARLWGVEQGAASRRVEELAETLDLGELLARAVATYSGGERRDSRVDKLSGGMRRRLLIARALVHRPRLLLLDEPTVGLDPRIRHELLEVIGRLRDRTEMTIMLTTHYLDEAERLCDRVAIIHAGQIIALDTPAALVAGLGDELVELRVSHDPAAALASLHAHGIAGDDAFSVGSTLTVPVHHATAAAAMAGIHDAGLGASSITARRPTLDDVYLQLTGGRFAEAA